MILQTSAKLGAQSVIFIAVILSLFLFFTFFSETLKGFQYALSCSGVENILMNKMSPLASRSLCPFAILHFMEEKAGQCEIHDYGKAPSSVW